MSELGDLLKEALIGADPLPRDQGEGALRIAVRTFERRWQTVRLMAWSMVAFMTLVFVVALVLFWNAPQDVGPKQLVVYAVIFLWSALGIGFGKIWLVMMQNNIRVMKELKRVQILMLELRRAEPPL